MPAVTLYDAALFLLRARLAGERVEVTEESRPAYLELVEAGRLIPLHRFSRENEGHFRLTEAGWCTNALFVANFVVLVALLSVFSGLIQRVLVLTGNEWPVYQDFLNQYHDLLQRIGALS